MKGKRIIAAIGISSLLWLTACDSISNINAPDLSGNIELSGTVSCGTLKAEADISRNDGVWKITCTAPDSINGMEIVTDGTQRKITHSGIVFDYKTEDVPFISAFDYIIAAIDSTAQKDSFSLSQSGTETRLSGTVLSSGYILTVDSKGDIVSLSAGGYNFTAVKDDKKEG